MRALNHLSIVSLGFFVALGSTAAAKCSAAGCPATLEALKGLAPFSVLGDTPEGKAALASNYAITGAIQSGTANQPALQPFPQQQQQALRDAFITGANGEQLADGLGTRLGDTYQSLVSTTSPDDGKDRKRIKSTNISPALAQLFGYSVALSGADSNAGKYLFANATTDGKIPASPEAKAILQEAGGHTDVFGTAYNDPAGGLKADPYGDSRPFQTEKNLTIYSATDYFGIPQTNTDYLSAAPDKVIQDLTKNPAFPSGHTTYGYTESLLFALMVPERYPQMITRAAEYGNSRIVLGAHYAMDVIAGRTLALHDVAHMLANDPHYVGQKEGKFTITDYPAALQAAKQDLLKALSPACGGTIPACAQNDQSRFRNQATNAAFYESTQTYGLPVVYPNQSGKTEDVYRTAPDAGYLLTFAFPGLTLHQADDLLTATEGPGGGFLDNGSEFGLYSRLDLYQAATRAAAMQSK